MKQWFIFVLLISISLNLLGKKLAELPDISRPYQLWIDDRYLYVTEGTTVFIFSLKDYHLKNKFGKEGEGPQEFKIPPGVPGVFLSLQTDSLVVNSLGKISEAPISSFKIYLWIYSLSVYLQGYPALPIG